MGAVDTVVFDLGGVLVRWDREHLYRQLIPDPERRRWFLEEVCSPAWNLEQDRGRSWEEGIALLVARFPAEAALIRAYRERWEEMVPGVFEGTVALLERLSDRGVPLFALTNFNSETLGLCKARFPFFQRFRGITVSAEEGLLKPDPALYRRMIDRFGLVPSRTLFIDDVPENVAAAHGLGFQGHRFLDPATLEQELDRLGLL